MKKTVASLLGFAVILSSLPPTLWAGTGIEEELFFADIPVVFAASRQNESIQTAASNITVITSQQIKDWGLRSVADAVHLVPGFAMAYDRDEWVFQARGVSADNTTNFMMSVDGQPVNMFSGWGVSHIMDLPNDLSNVKQIEFIKGPGSVVWGNEALAGIINIVTKDAGDYKKENNFSMAGGTQNTQKGDFQFARKSGQDSDYVISGTFVRSDGALSQMDASTNRPNFDSVTGLGAASGTNVNGNVNGPYGRYTTAIDRYYPSYKVQVKGRSGDFKYNAYSFFNDENNKQYEVNKGRDARMSREQYFVQGEWEKTFFTDLDLDAKLTLGHSRQNYDPVSGGTIPVAFPGYGQGQFNFDQSEDRSIVGNFDVKKPFFHGVLSTISGVEDAHRQMWRMSENPVNYAAFGSAPASATYSFNINDETLGLYTMWTLTPFSMLHLTAGVRGDYNQKRGDKNWLIAPRYAAVFEPTHSSVFKLLYNTGFLRPAEDQKTKSTPTATQANVEIPSEQMTQTDFVYLQRLGPLNLSTTLYVQELKDIIFLQSGSLNTSVYVPGPTQTGKGVEVQLDGHIGPHMLWVTGNYGISKSHNFTQSFITGPTGNNYIDNERVDTNGNTLGYFKAGVNAGVALHFIDKITVAPMVRWTAPILYRTLPATGADVNTATYAHTKSLFYADLSLGFEPIENLGFSVAGFNLTNNRHELPMSVRNGSYQPVGRSVEARVSLKW